MTILYTFLIYLAGFIITAMLGRAICWFEETHRGSKYTKDDADDLTIMCVFWPAVWIFTVTLGPILLLVAFAEFLLYPKEKKNKERSL